MDAIGILLSRENLEARRAEVLEKVAAAQSASARAAQFASARAGAVRRQRACSITRRITESTVVVFSVLRLFFSAPKSWSFIHRRTAEICASDGRRLPRFVRDESAA